MQNKIGKKIQRFIATIMAALMVMTAWVFVEPMSADAVDTGLYSYEVKVVMSDGASAWNNGDLTVYGKSNNGKGSEIQIATKSGMYVEQDSGIYSWCIGSSTSFPSKLTYYYNFGGGFTWRSMAGTLQLYVGGTLVGSQSFSASSSAFSAAKGTVTLTVASSCYPKASSVVFDQSPSSVIMPKTGSTTTSMCTHLNDQYGVRVSSSATGYSKTSSLTSNRSSTTGISCVAGTTTATYDPWTITIANSAKLTDYDTNTITAKVSYTFNGVTVFSSNTFTITDPTYTFTFNGNGGTSISPSASIAAYYYNNPESSQIPSSGVRPGYEFIAMYGDAKSPNYDFTKPTPGSTSGYTGQLTTSTPIEGDKTWYAAWWAKNLTATFIDNENNVVGTVQGKVDKTLGKVSASDVYAIAIPEYIEKSDDNNNYVFSGWIVDSAVDANGDDYTEIISGMSPDEAILQGDVTFRAAYDVAKNSYNVKFYDVNGNLTEAEYAYNELPTQPDDQNLDENNTYTYLFKGWKKVSDGRTDYYLVDENGYDDNGNYIPVTTDFTVRTDAVYVPVFEKVYKEYTVSFTYDGVTNKTVYNGLHYGDTYEVPVPEASYINDGYRYTYNGWMLNGNPATPETVKGNAAYVADYTIAPAVYTVRFFDYDGTQINDQDDQYNHGDAIRVTNADATQVYTDDSYEYTFDHFECSDGDTFVDGSLALTDVDYYAVYNKTELIYYNVTWLDENNKILQTQTVRSGSDAVYSGKTPTKSADDNYHYIFKGWSDETTNIQEDISVTTVFEAAAHNYSVVSVTDPTCITDGYTTYTCSVCGESYTDNIVDPLGHDYVPEHFEKDEENDGYTLYTCSRCGDSYTVIDPAQPVESFVAIAGAYQISLSWLKSPEASVTGYKIYRKTANEEYALIKTITSRNTLSYIDSPLDADTEYTYKIMAVKGDIPGEYSEEISCTPERDTQPPEITSATPANMSKLNKTITFKVNSTDNMSYVSYTIEYINSTDKESTVVVTSDLMECSCDFSYAFDTASLSDGTYNFVFTATDKEGNVSDKITRTYLIDNTPPEKVEQLTATVVYDTKLTLKWKDVSDADRAGYRLQQKDGDTYKTIASSVSTIGYNVSSLVPNTEYTFRVAAYDQLGNIGEYSDDYTISTTADETAPTITKLSPIPARYSDIIPFSATAKDDYAISEIKIQISEDKEAWTTVYTETFSSKSSATCSAEIDVSGEKEGSLFVRAVATDSFGNVSDESETAAYVEYYIDHTAPLSPENVSAVGYDGYIGISWEQGSESDLAKYSLYRSEEENGTYELLSSSINTINYYDRSVERGKVYYYKLAVNDTAGNLSAYSQIVFASALSDEEKPEIVSISPSDGESLSPSSNVVSVLAKDNNELSTITIEYKLSDEDEYTTLETFSGIGNYYKTVSTSVDLSAYDTATVINIRAYCTDVSGYTSSYSYRTLKVDKTAPKVTNLSAVLCDKTITVSWNDDGESDLSGFKIYKSKNGSSYSAVATRSVSTSRYYSVINTLDAGTYTYRIDAYDNYGNSKSYYTDSLVIKSEPNISPVIDCVSYIEAGVSETFSSASSVHDYDISAYLWDFGDGTTSVKANPTKSYKQAGTYTVSLTLTDVNGVSKTASKSVTVNERNMLGTSRIRVVNESGSGVASIPVYFDLGQDNQQVVYTNSNGYASAVLSVGKHIVGAYKTGYLPVTKEVTVLSASVTDTVLNITEENIISGEFTVTEMTLDEIVAAGIDVSDPANQQTYQVSVTLIYGEQKIPVTYIRNDTKIISFKIDDYDFKTNNSNYKPISISYIPNDRNEEIIAVAAIDCTASYLKQFFNATLTIFNNAAESFNIVDCSADINVPDGLTVVKNSPISSVIPGQSSSSETWILRGDKEGTYNLTSSFSGNLDVFNVPVSATFKADNSVHVYGTDSVKLRFEVEDTIEDDGSLFFNIMLINQRDVNVYNPIINVGGITDKLIEYLQAEGENTESLTDDEKAAIKNAYILPLRIRVDHSDGTTDLYDYSPISPVDTLAPGDSLVYEFEAKGLKTNGALGYFNRAIIDCDEDYAGSIEVVTMGDKPVYISEDDFVKEHLDFLSSGGYTAIATPFSIDIGTEAGKSFEKKWDQFIELDYFTNYCELVLCDFILKDSTYSRYEKIQKEKYFSSVKKWTSAISDAVMLDKYASYTQGLNKNKIEKILEGASYESNDYRVLNKVLGMMFDDGTIKELYSAYNFTGNMISIFNTGADMVNRIRNSMSYASAVDAYREFSDTLKELFENASLDTSNKKMKDAMNSFIAADSSEFESNLIKSGAYLKGIGLASFDALKFVYKDMLVKTVKNTVASTLSGLTTIFTEQAIQETVGGIAIGYSLGTLIAKVAANTGDISSDLSRLQANSYLAEGFYNELLESAEALKSNPTYENASYFCQAFTSYKSIQVTSWEILVKYATDKNDALAVKIFHKDKYVDDISSMQTSCNYAKSVFCHGYNHQVAQKTVVVECPVNVTILNSYGDTVAYLTDDGAIVSDENISAVVIDQKKIITMPCTDEYQIVIDAYDSGTMTYTVLEYNELAENIKSIVFEDIGLMEADRFTGSINAECLTAEINYALTKNDVETIEADYSQLHEVTGLEFEDDEVQIVFGTQCRLNPVIYPSDVENTSCIWTSSDENVLKVDSEGNITTLSLGTAQVKAVTCDGGFTDTIWITVLPCDDHIFGEYEIIKNATCTEDGERQRICTVCGYTEVSKIDAEHNYVAQVTAPGCTTEGYTMHTCSVCGYSYIDSKVSALGHSFTNYISDNNATCTKDGTKTAKCDRCEITNTVTDNDSMLEHKESEWIIDKKSGCTETGSKHTQCTVCGKTIQTQIIPAAGHKFVEETVAPACEKDGSVMRCCTVCGAYETVEVLPATGHSDENHDGICDNCGLNISISENCTCMCHKTGFMGFIYKIIRIFWKLFKVNKTCACGAVHY